MKPIPVAASSIAFADFFQIDPSARLVHRGHGADRDAGRVLAVIASRDLKNAAGVGERPLLDVLHPSAVDGERNVIFGLTGYGAGVTADALAVVDDESVSYPQNGCAAWVLYLTDGFGLVTG